MKQQIIDYLMPYLEFLTILSISTFSLSLFFIPFFIARLPREYFLKYQTHPHYEGKRLHVVLLVLRNIAGIVLVAAGILMLFLPGQGLLTILIGILCMSFKGKRNMILSLISKSTIQKSLNWTRNKMKKPPFHWHEKV